MSIEKDLEHAHEVVTKLFTVISSIPGIAMEGSFTDKGFESDFILPPSIEIGHGVLSAAIEIFEHCECKEDYCIQDADEDGAVFGCVNRIIWSPFSGFRADRSCCTSGFLDKFDKLKDGGWR